MLLSLLYICSRKILHAYYYTSLPGLLPLVHTMRLNPVRHISTLTVHSNLTFWKLFVS